MADGQIYQLTNMFTGVQGITPLSPVLTWAPQADRMAFVYYEDGQYSVYSLENPRSLRRAPYRGPAAQPVVSLLQAETGDTVAPTPRPAMVALGGTGAPTNLTTPSAPASIYRSAAGFRPSALPQPAESSAAPRMIRSEEHTSELQSLAYLVCRLLLEKKKKNK